MMLYSSFVCEFGGAKITLLCRFVKTRVGKTCAVVGRMWCGKVGKENRENMI